MRKIKRPKIGEYVLVTEWRDKDPRDPWRIGFVKALIIYKGGIRFRVDNDIREYKHCWRISEEEGRAWIEAHLTPRAADGACIHPRFFDDNGVFTCAVCYADITPRR